MLNQGVGNYTPFDLLEIKKYQCNLYDAINLYYFIRN